MKTRFWIFAFLAVAFRVLAEPMLTPEQWTGEKPAPAETLISQGSERFAARLNADKLTIAKLRPDGVEEVVLETSLSANGQPAIGGIAVFKDQLVISLTKEETLIFVSLGKKQITSKQSLPDFPLPRGLAFDGAGKLWAISGNTLAELQFTEDGHFNPVHHRGDFEEPRHLLISKDGHFFISENGAKPQIQELNSELKTIKTTPLQALNNCVRLCSDGTGKSWALLADGSKVKL